MRVIEGGKVVLPPNTLESSKTANTPINMKKIHSTFANPAIQCAVSAQLCNIARSVGVVANTHQQHQP